MAVNEGNSVRLDIDCLVSSIEDMVPEDPLNRLVSSLKDMMPHDSLMPPKCCIFKIPVILFRHNKEAFIPNAFSIGPLHHGKRKLKATEKIKAKYLQGLISRSHSPDTMLRIMVSSIMKVEKEARGCYAEAIHYNQDELVKILVIDGCFLIELLRKNAYAELIEEDDPIFTRSCMKSFVNHDLILLENQVPWMVLERLFNLTKDFYDENPDPLIALVTIFMKNIFHSYRINPRSDQCINMEGIKHFVDLLRRLSTLSRTDPRPDLSINIEGTNHFVNLFMKLLTLSRTLFRKLSTLSSTLFRKLSTLSSSEEKKDRRRGWELLPSATSLVEAGIKFQRNTSQSFLDVKFNDGVLEIPPLQIDDITETVFRNLISYEQCLPRCVDSFTSYAMLLDNLIITAKDMDILCENKIIENWLNPVDAAQLFNKLYNDTTVYYLHTDVCREVNRFCKRHWPRWRAVLVRNYFNTPWAVLSTLAAIILLILTLLQTLYSIKK